ncbi:methyltransferase domain protein [Clostridiales bacterium oral taxon 876 str. F0540]|nr:methyltransferase domain protein [Clostridiales bacterium oral taxon 876 str. F0540]
MSQYKDFAAVYDELINSDIDYNTWADKIIKLCSKYNIEKSDYLDLACGTGNLTNKIAKNFKRIWAVDLSEQMLTEAEGKFRAEGIKAKLVCQDICSLKLNNSFDLITCCLDSTNYITEDKDMEAYFKGVYNHLKDNGLFIFDVNSYYKLTEILGNNTFTFDNEEVVYIWDNFLEDDIVSMNLTFFVKEDNNYRRFDEVHSERAYSQEYLDKIIGHTGFRIIEKLNNYESIKVDKECERIVYVLGKEGK